MAPAFVVVNDKGNDFFASVTKPVAFTIGKRPSCSDSSMVSAHVVALATVSAPRPDDERKVTLASRAVRCARRRASGRW